MAGNKFEDRWEHFRDLVEHLFLEPGHAGMEFDVVWYPATDAYETEEEFVIRLDLGGVRREDIRVQIRDRVLFVQGIRREAVSGAPVRFHKMEIAKGPFARTILVPERFAPSSTRAVYRDGVLEIALRAEAPAEAENVEVHIEIAEAP